MGWLAFLCQLHRWHAAGPMTAAPTLPRWRDEDAADLQAMLFDTPVHVPLSGGKTRGVYPKGDFAIDRIALIDGALHWLNPRRVALEAAEQSPESIEALRLVVQLQHQLQRAFVWIVTHPGPDVPWEDDGRWEYEPPLWTRAYAGHDLLLLRAAYIEANYRRLNVVADRTRALAGSASGTVSKEAFTGVMASELGVSSVDIVHKWSRGSITAIAFTKWETMERARERANAA